MLIPGLREIYSFLGGRGSIWPLLYLFIQLVKIVVLLDDAEMEKKYNLFLLNCRERYKRLQRLTENREAPKIKHRKLD